ncbi:MAG: efflux RND transporter permease subunit, partial [Bryobacteraceae bacterium]|nr:efflux RND transporter permease subunit [Bryobacteraceae bacterium]
MIAALIRTAMQHRWLVLAMSVFVMGFGVYAIQHQPIDAYPDISAQMVQVITVYPGRAPEEVERQVTIPVEIAMRNVPRVEVIRSRTIFGLSVVQMIFEEGTDSYWARQRVQEKLSGLRLPEGAEAELGPLATAYGEIYRYELVSDGTHDLMDLRTLNEWVVIPRLLRVPGVAEAQVDLGSCQATLRLRPDAQVAREQLAEAVASAGYRVPDTAESGVTTNVDSSLVQLGTLRPGARLETARPKSEPPHQPRRASQPTVLDLEIGGMHCGSCVARVESALRSVPGVREANVSLASQRARVVASGPAVDVSALQTAVAAAGYTAAPAADWSDDPAAAVAALRSARAAEVASWARRLQIGVILTLPLLVLGIGPMLVPSWSGWSHSPTVALTAFALATLVQLNLGWPYILGAWQRARRRSANMDTLIALGTTTAYSYSLYHLIRGDLHQTHYFLDAALILTLITLGKWLEARSRGLAAEAIERLLDLAEDARP